MWLSYNLRAKSARGVREGLSMGVDTRHRLALQAVYRKANPAHPQHHFALLEGDWRASGCSDVPTLATCSAGTATRWIKPRTRLTPGDIPIRFPGTRSKLRSGVHSEAIESLQISR